MKLTKIVATIGPASDDEDKIAQMLDMGVNVVRFNFKHADIPWHEERIARVKKIASEKNLQIGTLLDLQGPEIRLRTNGTGIELKKGEWVEMIGELNGDETNAISVTQPEIIAHLETGQLVLSDDGAFRFTAHRENDKTFLEPLQDGFLKNRKTLNLPGANIPLDVLSEQDYLGLDLAARAKIDFVALSFVRNRADVETLREQMRQRNIVAQIIAKIENPQAIEHLDEIIDATDGVMVARGDMGVEMPFEEVPYYTRLIIAKCVELGKPVITATQMLESMIESPFPTRAEVSDVATATYTFSDAVMLSGESANGAYPMEAIEVMKKTVTFNEIRQFTDTRTHFHFKLKTQTELLSESAYDLYQSMRRHSDVPLDGFVVFTHTGLTARVLSKFRPRLPIFAVCPSVKVARSLSLSFGVYAFVYDSQKNGDTAVEQSQVRYGLDFLLSQGSIIAGNKYLVVYGDRWSVEGGSSTVKVMIA